MKLRQLWDWRGEVGRAAYLIWGALLLAVKWNIDRFAFESWPDPEPVALWDYLHASFPPAGWFSREMLSQAGWWPLAVATAFLWAGLVLTVGRLRSAGLPLGLAVLFVVPVLKWLLFLVAIVAPPRQVPRPLLEGVRVPPNRLQRLCPTSRLGSATFGVLLATGIAVGGVLLGGELLEQYGLALFLGVPFVSGFVAAAVHGAREPRGLGESLGVAFLSLFLMAVAILALAIEGIICMVMAAPIASVMTLFGAFAGHSAQPALIAGRTIRTYCAVMLAVPLMYGGERLAAPPAPLLEVRSSIEVAAPPERVWRHVVEFSELPPPTEWLFRAGIAYPVRAEIEGSGPGAVRRCVFSTGAFVEPIEVWEEPRLLRFGVTECPPPLEEWSPFADVHPPHLDGFLVSERGQFRLEPLPGGRTRLEGTTWYRHHMWPVAYWQLWSDAIIHRIHLRVLEHIRERAEGEGGGG